LPVHVPVRRRQADRAVGPTVKQAVPIDVVEDGERRRPADRVVPGRAARLERDPLSLWTGSGRNAPKLSCLSSPFSNLDS